MNAFKIFSRSLLVGALFIYFTPIYAQILRGSVRDKDTGKPLPGAVITWKGQQNDGKAALSDAAGNFRMENLVIETGALLVQLSGYADFSLSEVTVAAGKEKIIDFLLSEGNTEASLSAVDIIAVKPLRQTAPLGEIPLSREQTLYYPMTYFDPARLAAAWPGVAQTDDGTNSMSIRGNNSAFVRWRLQGLDIISPNHLPNAGTFTDRPNIASGGVLMLSAQMIDNSSLITGAGTVGYNDGIAGIMDLHLRKGNDQRHEQTIQAGLTGIDLAFEGPLSKKKKGASYLLNYRYSTVGLLGKLGVSFGGEVIDFQDLAIHLNFPTGKRSNLSFYALGGKSSNYFTPPDTAVIYKDLFNIDFESRTGVLGVTHTGYAGDNFTIKTGAALSGQDNLRQQYNDTLYLSDELEQYRLSLNTSMRLKVTESMALLFGGNFSFNSYVSSRFGAFNLDEIYQDDAVFQSWLAGESTLLDGAVKIQLGINPIVTYYGSAYDPRLQFFWRPHRAHQLSLSFASYSQSSPLWASEWDGALMQSVQYAVRYQWSSLSKWVISAEIFDQSISNLAISRAERNGFSVINETDPLYNGNVIFEGNGHNRGIELMAFRKMATGWFLNTNLTLLESEYEGSDERVRPSRWDVGHIANLTAGKEWRLKRKKEKLTGRVFGIDSRAVWTGGARTLPIDEMRSANEGVTVFDYSNGFTGKNGDYFRIDGRFYWKRSISNRRNSTFALEFQNLTGQQNVAYRYFDPFTKRIEIKYQLGLIPNLSWRLEF